MVMLPPIRETMMAAIMLWPSYALQFAMIDHTSAMPMQSVQHAMNMDVAMYLNFFMAYQFRMHSGVWLLRSFTTSPLDFC